MPRARLQPHLFKRDAVMTRANAEDLAAGGQS